MVPRTTGGIRQLCELIDEYSDELEADFRQFYGLRLRDVFRGALAPREALVLAGQLWSVPSSRYRAEALGDPAFLGFGRAEEIAADTFDALVDNSIVTVKAAGGKANKPGQYPRPQPRAEQGRIEVFDIDDFPIHLIVGLTRGPQQ